MCKREFFSGICFSMLIDRYESPINIDTNKTRVLNMHKPLIWNGYQALPASITMENTGDTGECTALVTIY